MSSPLTPVIDGSPAPAARVVWSFCLKSPPILVAVSFTDDANCVWAAATTAGLSPPSQYQSDMSWMPPVVVPLPAELEEQLDSGTTPRPRRAAKPPPRRTSRRETCMVTPFLPRPTRKALTERRLVTDRSYERA